MSYPTGAIKEANSHIEALTRKNLELEEKVKELSHVIRKQNEAHAENLAVLPLRMKQTMTQKDEEIGELKNALELLQQDLKKKESLLQHYKYKCKIIDELVRHKDALESVVTCLDLMQENTVDNNNGHIIVNPERETDLTNGYYQSDDDGKEIPRHLRIDSGKVEEDEEDNEIVAV